MCEFIGVHSFCDDGWSPRYHHRRACYKYVSEFGTFTHAVTGCRQMGAQLAVIEDDNELTIIKELINYVW